MLKEGIKYDLGLLKVRLVYLFHDVDNYALKWEINGKKGIYAVDTNKIDHIVAQDYDLYLIESNYNEDLLEQHIQECEDEDRLYYLDRVKRTHLSSKACNDFLLENMGENSEYVRIHKSQYNYKEID